MVTGPRLDPFLAAARTALGGRHVLTSAADTAGYVVDWTRRWTGATGGVVRPASTDEVAALVAAARKYHVALVPQGGNTGLVGGAVPQSSYQVVVDMRRLTTLEPVDELAGQVTAGAGATLGALQAHAAAAGLRFGVDLGARDSATVGGMLATNAGGLHVVRHGSMRSQVVGVEAVLGTGGVVSRLSGLVKDNTGYDLAQLLCGSEGTLGLVTRVRLRLVPPPGELVVGLLAVASMDAAVQLAAGLRRGLPGVQALEVMDGDSMRLVADGLGVPPPVAAEAAAFLLVEVAGSDDPTDSLAAALSGLEAGAGSRAGLHDAATRSSSRRSTRSSGAGARAGLLDAAVATSGPDRARLWRFREAHPEVVATFGVVHKMDVTLPTAALADFCVVVRAEVARRWPDAVTLVYGHVGDGNVHVNVVLPAAAAAPGVAPVAGTDAGPGEGGRGVGDDREGREIDDLVLGLVVERGGSISAEHGIGIAKKHWLARDRTPAELDAMRAVKAALDPDGILNPDVLLP